jgi:hypothetical protein
MLGLLIMVWVTILCTRAYITTYRPSSVDLTRIQVLSGPKMAYLITSSILEADMRKSILVCESY